MLRIFRCWILGIFQIWGEIKGRYVFAVKTICWIEYGKLLKIGQYSLYNFSQKLITAEFMTTKIEKKINDS